MMLYLALGLYVSGVIHTAALRMLMVEWHIPGQPFVWTRTTAALVSVAWPLFAVVDAFHLVLIGLRWCLRW